MRLVFFSLNILFCVLYVLMVSMINSIFPIEHFKIQDGLLIISGSLVLFVSQLIAMILFDYFKKKLILYGLIIIQVIYWFMDTESYPYRRILLLLLSVAIFITYVILLQRYVKN